MDGIKLISDTEGIQPVLAQMEVNEVVAFPANKLCSVRTTCSNYGFQTGRRYRAVMDRENMQTKVIRLK